MAKRTETHYGLRYTNPLTGRCHVTDYGYDLDTARRQEATQPNVVLVVQRVTHTDWRPARKADLEGSGDA